MRFKSEQFKEIVKESWDISWPMVLIMLFEFFMGLADVYVAGRVSSQAQAAYGLAFQIYIVFLIPTMAFTNGTVSLVSRLFGAGSPRLKSTASTSLMAMLVFGSAACIFAVFIGPLIVSLMHVPWEIKPLAARLIQIYAFALAFEYPLINANGILRSCGRIRRALLAMTLACALNIILNFFFVLCTPMKATGIALATVISLFVGLVFVALPTLQISGLPKIFDRGAAGEMVSLSWPIGLLQILWSTGAIALVGILGSLPKDSVAVLAAFTAGLKVESAIFLPAFAFNMANAVVVGNMLGKNDTCRAYRAGFITAGMGVVLVAVLSLVVVCNARQILGVLSDNPLVIDNGVSYICISLLFEPLMAWGVILGGGLSGAGYNKDVMLIVGGSIWLVRLPLCYICGVILGWGAVGVWWAMNVSVICQGLLTIWRYRRRMRPVEV